MRWTVCWRFPALGWESAGFLAGIRRANVVQILDRIEIPCLHALGPGFLLTSEELENARKLAAHSRAC